jgi:chromosome segregation ATPase
MPDELSSPRTFKEPSLSENKEYMEKLNEIQEHMQKLSQYKHLIIEAQGHSDELKSRIIEKDSQLSEVEKANSKLKSDLHSYTEFMTSEINSAEAQLANNKNESSSKLIQKDSSKQIISNLIKEHQSEEQESFTLDISHQVLLQEIQDLETQIQLKQEKISEKSLKIKELLNTSSHFHSLFLQDEETKFKLNEKISKFQQIRKN